MGDFVHCCPTCTFPKTIKSVALPDLFMLINDFLTNVGHNTWTATKDIPYYTLYVSNNFICSM